MPDVSPASEVPVNIFELLPREQPQAGWPSEPEELQQGDECQLDLPGNDYSLALWALFGEFSELRAGSTASLPLRLKLYNQGACGQRASSRRLPE